MPSLPRSANLEGAQLLSENDMSVTLHTEENVLAFAEFLREEASSNVVELVRRLVLRIEAIAPHNMNTLMFLIQQLSNLTTLWLAHTERILFLCPPLANHIAGLECLQNIRFANAGAAAYGLLARMRSQLVDVVISDPPGSVLARYATPASLLQHSLSTLTTIEMPNVSLDLRARAAQFPRVKRVIVAYDRVELLSLGAYKHAFPKLRSFKITEPRTPTPYGDWNALVARRRNQPANQPQLGHFERLERVEMPMGALWILGLHMHIDVVVLSIDLSFPMTFLGEVLNDLRPRHLRMHFGSTEAASVLFNHSRTSFGSPTAIWFSTLVLAIPLPSEVLQFGILLSSLVQNAKNFPCEDLIIEFSQKPLGSLTAVPVRATYLAHLNMEKVTRHIARNAGSNLRRLAVFVPNVVGVQLPGSMTIFVADAAWAPLSAPVVQRSQQQILPATWM